MSYWREIKGLKYHYGTVDGKRDTLVAALGVMDTREADRHCAQWDIDNGRDKHNISRRSMASVWEEYLRFLVSEERSPKSIRCAHTCVLPFVMKLDTIRDTTPEAIQRYDNYLREYTWKRKESQEPRLLSKETRAHRLRAISAFLGWMVTTKLIKKSPFEIKIPPQRKDAGRALQPSEVLKLFDHWPKPRWDYYRKSSEMAQFFIMMVFYAGTRLTELLGDPEHPEKYPGACYEDLDRQNMVLKLGKTKSGEPRYIALPKVLVDLIPEGSGPIFRGQLTEAQIRHYLKMAKKAAGIQGRLRIHDGRVTAATRWALLNPSGNAKLMMDQFGWQTHSMATHYTKIATSERVRMAQKMDYTFQDVVDAAKE